MSSLHDAGAKKVWACLLTNEGYLRGVLTLHYSLVKSGTKYPFYVIYTDVKLSKVWEQILSLRL
jgi:hypothetical protein